MEEDLFLREKPISILFQLDTEGDKFVLDIGRKTSITLAHIHKIINILIEGGLVSREKKGRKILLNLTVKGKFFVEEIRKIKSLC